MKILKPVEHAKKLDTGTLSIEYRETNGKRLYLTVFRAAYKPLFSALLTVGSRCKRVEEKAAKHQLKIAVLYTEPASGKRIPAHCTCNFTRHEDMVSYEEEFGKAVESLKQ